MHSRTIGLLGLSALFTLSLLPLAHAQDTGPAAQGEHRGMRGGPGGRGMDGPAGRGGRGPGGPEQALERRDANADGQISLDEFVDAELEHVDAMFERRDANGDGLISVAESTPPARPDRPDRPERPDRPARADRPGIDREAVAACVKDTIADYAPDAELSREDRFEDTDANGDGSLSLGEVTTRIEAQAAARFDRIDADANGFITTSELEAHRDDLREVRRTVRDCVRESAGA